MFETKIIYLHILLQIQPFCHYSNLTYGKGRGFHSWNFNASKFFRRCAHFIKTILRISKFSSRFCSRYFIFLFFFQRLSKFYSLCPFCVRHLQMTTTTPIYRLYSEENQRIVLVSNFCLYINLAIKFHFHFRLSPIPFTIRPSLRSKIFSTPKSRSTSTPSPPEVIGRHRRKLSTKPKRTWIFARKNPEGYIIPVAFSSHKFFFS